MDGAAALEQKIPGDRKENTRNKRWINRRTTDQAPGFVERVFHLAVLKGGVTTSASAKPTAKTVNARQLEELMGLIGDLACVNKR